jgi:hypothetical protein
LMAGSFSNNGYYEISNKENNGMSHWSLECSFSRIST